jgi:hypothetical protein
MIGKIRGAANRIHSTSEARRDCQQKRWKRIARCDTSMHRTYEPI